MQGKQVRMIENRSRVQSQILSRQKEKEGRLPAGAAAKALLPASEPKLLGSPNNTPR